jgi:very-short-patch-repair endonuclease
MHSRVMANAWARASRHHPTSAELALWKVLRDQRLAACKFRRQHPIGPFVADFACVELRLVVEVDGGQHDNLERDERRTVWLQSQGWHVVRFWNLDVQRNMAVVTELLVAEIALSRGRHPHPPRQGAATSPA